MDAIIEVYPVRINRQLCLTVAEYFAGGLGSCFISHTYCIVFHEKQKARFTTLSK